MSTTMPVLHLIHDDGTGYPYVYEAVTYPTLSAYRAAKVIPQHYAMTCAACDSLLEPQVPLLATDEDGEYPCVQHLLCAVSQPNQTLTHLTSDEVYALINTEGKHAAA